MTPAGEIKDMTVPWLFQAIRAESKTGTAAFTRGDAVKKVCFQDGDIIFSSSNVEDDRLGQCLLRSGKIGRAEFEASLEIIKKTGKSLGPVLVELGLISHNELVSGVKLQAKRIIMDLLTWRTGTYTFEEGQVNWPRLVPLETSTGNLIVEGLRDVDWSVIRKSLPSVKTTLRPSVNPSVLFQSADLEQDHRLVLSLIDGQRSIEELCVLTEIGDFNTLKAVYVLLGLKLIETGKIKTEQEKRFIQDIVQEVVAEKRVKGTSAAAPSQTDAPTKDMIQAAYDAVPLQDHYQVLGVEKSAKAEELRRAYLRLAKIYHPDTHFNPEMGGLKDKLELLFRRIHEAYETLRDPARRHDYDHPSTKKTEAEKEKAPEPQAGPVDGNSQARINFDAGMKEFKIGNFWGAAEAFSSAARLDPGKADYFYQYGLTLTQIPRRQHEAEEKLKKAVELDPRNPAYRLELVALYLKRGLKSKAFDIYQAALREKAGPEKIREVLEAAGIAVPGDEK